MEKGRDVILEIVMLSRWQNVISKEGGVAFPIKPILAKLILSTSSDGASCSCEFPMIICLFASSDSRFRTFLTCIAFLLGIPFKKVVGENSVRTCRANMNGLRGMI